MNYGVDREDGVWYVMLEEFEVNNRTVFGTLDEAKAQIKAELSEASCNIQNQLSNLDMITEKSVEQFTNEVMG